MNLKYFTQPEILRQIGSRRLEKLLHFFRNDLQAENVSLPAPETENGSYLDCLASTLASLTSLPERLRGTLFALEAAVAPENASIVDDAIARRIPNIGVSSTCTLDRALELWFHAPEELSQFQISTRPEASPSHPPEERGRGEKAVPPTTETLPHGVSSSSQALPFLAPEPDPWPEPVDLKVLLDRLVELLKRFVILPPWAAETLALWTVHTYAFQLRDVTTYIGIESPEKRCGKTTLLSILNELAHRALASSNISPPAFFRVIEDLSPTLLIDEVDTFLTGNDQLRGILNAGYKKKTAFVLRAAPSATSNGEPDTETSAAPGVVKRYSCWCPKALAKIGRFPDTLADRCIIIRMHRKTTREQCARLRELGALALRRQCARFVLDHQNEIATASPSLPVGLNDRAADIWEPLLVLADIAGGEWPELARQAAAGLTAAAQESSPIASLLFDICLVFTIAQSDRMFSRTLAQDLNSKFTDRPWAEMRKGKEITGSWLAQQLRPYGIRPRTLWIGEEQAKGYYQEDFTEAFQRYLPKAEAQAYLAELTKPSNESNSPALPPAASTSENNQSTGL